MNKNAYLIIHGFAGSTEEVSYLYNYLNEKNLDAYMFTLAGHGKSKRDLKNSSPEDWINSAKMEYEKLKNEYKTVNLIGFSMGGLIAAFLAETEADGKIVFINTPIYFWNLKVIVKDIFSGIIHRNYDKTSYYKKSLIGSSIKSGIDFLKVLNKAKKKIKNIKNKSLIIQCKNDESVKHKSAGFIQKNIGDIAEIKYYEGGCHQIFSEVIDFKEEVCSEIFRFFTNDNKTKNNPVFREKQ